RRPKFTDTPLTDSAPIHAGLSVMHDTAGPRGKDSYRTRLERGGGGGELQGLAQFLGLAGAGLTWVSEPLTCLAFRVSHLIGAQSFRQVVPGGDHMLAQFSAGPLRDQIPHVGSYRVFRHATTGGIHLCQRRLSAGQALLGRAAAPPHAERNAMG